MCAHCITRSKTYVPWDLPDIVSGYAKAASTAFDAEVVGATPTTEWLNRFSASNHPETSHINLIAEVEGPCQVKMPNWWKPRKFIDHWNVTSVSCSLLLAICLLLNSLQSVAANTSPVGDWRLSTETTVKVFPPKGSAVTSKPVEGVEFSTFKSDLRYLSSEWIDRLKLYFSDADGQYLLPLDLTGQWSGTGSAYTVTYDTSALSLRNKRSKNINYAFLSRSGYLALLTQALKYTPTINTVQIVAYSDSGKLTNKGKGLKGTKKTVFLVVWVDPLTGGTLQSEVDVSVTYKGTRITTDSNCCGSDAATNATDSQAFLALTKAMPAVVTTGSGLQYIALQQGSLEGIPPLPTDKVTVNYRGMYPSGAIFDSGSLVTFSLGSVISGWTEGLQLMKPGDKFRFFIPSSLAYGTSGNASIVPNAALVFDVELVEITKP